MGHHCLGPQRMRFEIERDIAAPGARRIGPAAGAAMDRNRSAGLFRGLVDRMKHRMPEPVVIRIVDQHHLDHALIVGVPPDFGRGALGQLAGNQDR